MSHPGMADQSHEERLRFENAAIEVVQAARDSGLTLRLLGSLAFHVHCPRYGYLQAALGRAYTDIDFGSYRGEASRMSAFFKELGYGEDAEINVLFAGQRMIFNHPSNSLHVDIFFDRLNFCHEINWEGRLEQDYPTIPLAEMLLEKMQIVKINEKDIIDTIMLLLEHPLGDHDRETINIALISRLCAADWGLWRTTTMNLSKVRDLAQGYDQLSQQDKVHIAARVEEALAIINTTPKTLAWKVRSAIGDSVKWYQSVDDVD